ncbi:hypothetical protein THRCLA_06498 [Thraustotheca clavata]|uniref:C2H2-type domain-containing protein n=1 Tax=Thraustotheca clavata TaxID=74557 RepID=A0A1V9ZNH9_9STRA|nr:hypothetical protein THRCLA_06498 [Thraustotheca clavata]
MSTAIAAAKAKTKGKKLLKDIINALGDVETPEEKSTALGEWNKRRTEAIAGGNWEWRAGTTPILASKHVKAAVTMEVASLVNIGEEMDLMLHPQKKSKSTAIPPPKVCCWSLLHQAKYYVCSNVLRTENELRGRRCNWHATACRCPTHKGDNNKIPIANDSAFCMACFAKAHLNEPKHKQTPVVVDILRQPGVRLADAQTVQHKSKNQVNAATKTMAAKVFTKSSLCTWEAFKPGQKSLKPYKCSNRVLQHPVYLTYLPLCGYHTTTCVYTGAQNREVCSDIVIFNQFGLCKNHYEALVSTFDIETRKTEKVFTSLFECPNVNIDKNSSNNKKKHPLAPKDPPPTKPEIIASKIYGGYISFLASLIPTIIRAWLWQINFLRKGPRVAVALQRVYRGNIARRRVHQLKIALYAKKRLAACILIQKLWRQRLSKQHVKKYKQQLIHTAQFLQRVVRGFLGRRYARHCRAQRNIYYAVGVTIAVHKAISILRARVDVSRCLRRDMSDSDTVAVYLFRRRHAVKVLVKAMKLWKARKEQALLNAQSKFREFMSAMIIQCSWKLYAKRNYLQRRYNAAQCIQARIRGRLTRRFWCGEPFIVFTTYFVNPKSGMEYIHKKLLPHPFPTSYSVKCRCIRYTVAAQTIQRFYRGYIDRLIANTKWADMEQRWLWIDPTLSDHSDLTANLPSASYHTDPDYHMRRIFNVPKPPEAFTQEFKDVLELYNDMNGIRSEVIPPLTSLSPMVVPEAIKPDVKDNGMIFTTTQPKKVKTSRTHGITLEMAIFPVGTLVDVKFEPRRQMQTSCHSGYITKQHPDKRSVDISYKPGLISLRGIAISEEKNVSIDRLSIAFQTEEPTSPTFEELATTALNSLHEQKITIQKIPSVTIPSPAPSEQLTPQLYHEMISTIRQKRKEFFTDEAILMNFVYHHHHFLMKTWLRVIYDIENGVNTDPMATSSPNGLHGFIQPLPEAAKQLKVKLEHLGYPSDPSASGGPMPTTITSPVKNRLPLSTVDEMTGLFHQEPPKDLLQTKDDGDISNENLSLADIHKLVYHLKSLPRILTKDPILKITTRDVRTFVCSHPACGRCFSTHQSARDHQHIHANKPRLVAGDPLVDQYMVKHWPPESPWRDDNYSFTLSKTGCFKCPDCEKEFRSKRELLKHTSHVHGQEPDKDRQSSKNQHIIWLGAGNPIQDLSIIFPSLFRLQKVPCCQCQLQIHWPTFKCRLYPSVSIITKSSGAVIFSSGHPVFAPEITLNCHGCGQLMPYLVNQEVSVLRRYLRLEGLCRGADQEDWMIGYMYQPPPVAASLQEALVWGYDYQHEVLLDDSHLVCVKATQCTGYGMVYSCSRTYFHRFYRGKSGHVEKFCRPLRTTTASKGHKARLGQNQHVRAQTTQ